jgi:hypothetical protein
LLAFLNTDCETKKKSTQTIVERFRKLRTVETSKKYTSHCWVLRKLRTIETKKSTQTIERFRKTTDKTKKKSYRPLLDVLEKTGL